MNDKQTEIKQVRGKRIQKATLWQTKEGDLTFEMIFDDDTSFSVVMDRPMPTAECVLLKGPDLERKYERTFKGKVQD